MIRPGEAGTLKPPISHRQRARLNRKLLFGSVAGLIVVALLAVAVFLLKAPATDEQKSVAVLLFENLRQDERFKQMMAQLNTKMAKMRKRVDEKGW